MAKNVVVVLEEDIFPNSNYQVFINKEMIKGKSDGENTQYQQSVSEPNAEIVIIHEDEWIRKDKIKKVFPWFISLDVWSGESVYDRLPIYADYYNKIIFENDNEDFKIHIKSSEILRVHDASLKIWKKVFKFQMVNISVTLFLISLLLIKIFTNGWVRVVLSSLDALGFFILWKNLNKRGETTLQLLEELSEAEESKP